MAITHDNQVYQVDAALIFQIEITSDNEYEQPNIDISESENVRFYGIYGKMSTTTNSVYFFGLAAYQESQNQYILIPISEMPDATEEEFDRIRDYVSNAFTESLFLVGGCVDSNGNSPIADSEYIDCSERARDKYVTKMNIRIRNLKRRGALGVFIVVTSGASCVAFPPTCPYAIAVGIPTGIAVMYDGIDAWNDYDEYADLLALDLRNCCRDLLARQSP